jgi:hypothetical protein
MNKYIKPFKELEKEFSKIEFPIELLKEEKEILFKNLEEALKNYLDEDGNFAVGLIGFKLPGIYGRMLVKESSKIELSEEEEEKISKTLEEESRINFEKFGKYCSKDYMESRKSYMVKNIKLLKFELGREKTSYETISDPLEVPA